MGPLSYSSSAFKSSRSIYANKFSRTGIVGRTALATTNVAFTKYTRAQRLQGRGYRSERVLSVVSRDLEPVLTTLCSVQVFIGLACDRV